LADETSSAKAINVNLSHQQAEGKQV
jgi:hypothetical protein